MASAWGASWGAFWGNSWGALSEQPQQPDNGFFGGGSALSFFRLEHRKRNLAKQATPDELQAVESAVQSALETHPTRDMAADLATAETMLRYELVALRIEWRDIFRDLLRLEYQLWLAEQEEAAIVMLLFEM